jgi:CO/xanthine dehydrogenase Mo-binding subunit/aerobic-type carbon monoxide dehydrogenase small subunit (CoxS/CutS family)
MTTPAVAPEAQTSTASNGHGPNGYNAGLEMTTIHLHVNGQPVTARVPIKDSLLDFLDQKRLSPAITAKLSLLKVLRDDLHLTGSKNGCGTNHCGNCMVLVNGKARKSCLLQMKSLQGAQVTTIEGLSGDGELHPIQAAFAASGGSQCGFCTPGMIISAKALLDANPNPTDYDIRKGLEDVICRCTGYNKIIDAVKLAARALNTGQTISLEPAGGLGKSVIDFDGVEKAQGRLIYADDIYVEGMLHLKAVWSAYPHALIKSVDTSAAEKVPGVVRVFTAKDVPGLNRFGVIKQDQPVLCDERARFVGDAIALVAAENELAAERARDLIRVDYEPLPGVFTAQQALQPDAPQLFPDGNICKHLVHTVGSLETGFAQSDLIVEGHFETPFVEHAYLEPESGVCWWDGDTLTLKTPTQFPFELRVQLSRIFNLAEDQVRVICTPGGGAFGSKIDATVEPLLALAAFCTGRPAKMTLTREESLIRSTKRHPYFMDYRVGLSREGKILAVDCQLLSDAGAYTDLSPRVIDQACIFSCGPYEVPNLRIEGWAVYTNNVKGSAFRGFGINQVAFAIESLLDEAARKLALDPFELRLRNCLRAGSATASGEILRHSVAIEETLIAAREALEKEIGEVRKRVRPGWKLGIGVASGFKNVGAGKGKVDDAGAVFTLLPDGKVQLRVSAVDFGQGIRTTMAQIARNVIPVSADNLIVISGDTKLTHKHGGAVAERQTLISGAAVEKAANGFKEQLVTKAAQIMGVPPESILLIPNGVASSDSESELTFTELAEELDRRGEVATATYVHVAPKTFALADVEGRKSVSAEEYRNYPAYAYITQACAVEANPNTGEVKVLRVWAAHDVGRAINPQKIEGQVEGSCLMALGYALTEDYPMEKGYPRFKTFGELGVPTVWDFSEVRTLIIEKPDPTGPFGAKGISEVATVPLTPSICNAIYDAVGYRAYALPATPARILAGLKQAAAEAAPAQDGRITARPVVQTSDLIDA